MDVKVYSAAGGKTVGGEMSLDEKRMCLKKTLPDMWNEQEKLLLGEK